MPSANASARRHQDAWTTAEHVREIVAIVATQALEREPGVISAHEAVTARGVRITVNRVARERDRVAHLVTLAGERSWVSSLKAITATVARAFGVRPKIVAERSHVTLLFTVANRDELRFRALLEELAWTDRELPST